MSDFFVYIATKSTADPYLPQRAISLEHLSRDVADAFLSLTGGRTQVGQLALYPIQRSVPNHLLCDGQEVSKAAFPELYSYLGDTQGTPADIANFVLPDYSADFTPAVAPEVETVEGGTVSTPPPAVPPPTYDPDRRDRLYGNVDSGGRVNPDTIIP